jgi:sec-independent protein translocase protein TatA
MFGLGPTELIVIFLLIIILFGAKRLPELARSLGSSIKEFKHATQGLKDEFDVDKIEDTSTKKNVQKTPSDTLQGKKSDSSKKN